MMDRVEYRRDETTNPDGTAFIRGMNAGAAGRAQHHRAGQAAARAMAHTTGVIDDLVNGGIGKPGELDFTDRLQTFSGHADAHAGDQVFCERGVDHTAAAEAIEQAQRRTKHAAVAADIFAQHDNVGVVGHGACQCQINGLNQCDLCHGLPPV